jgi:primosomal protein N' (replication factor Y) (superfamily II helicase)
MGYTAPMDQPARAPRHREHPATFVEVALALPLAQTFTYRVDAPERELAPGVIVRVPFGRREVIGVVTAVHEHTERERIRPVQTVYGEVYTLPPEALSLARKIADYYASSEGEALHLAIPPRPATACRRPPFDPEPGAEPSSAPELTDAQRASVEAVREALHADRFESFLLHGVTGSGKTEVYLQLVEDCLRRGRGALLLLPEIALTPQTLRRLRRRFPGKVAPYHSRLSHGERCAVWEAARRGEVPVVVGARSAVFAPVRDLGLIVVDEEHEPSYKADDRPRYHARDVALLRGTEQGVPVLLGSATPSLETYHNAREGKHRLLRLPDRVGAPGGLPEVRLVDRRTEGDRGIEPMGPALVEALTIALERGEQAIVFHNRRGFARYLQCKACGAVSECPRCDISLTYHLGEDRLRCHYCGFGRRRPVRCDACSADILDPRGTGTQRVELALESRFPGARILRLDQDSTTGKDDHRRLLAQFGRGEADVLVGTQMVAKGLHFPRVSVVGVIDADQGLHFPDFRAHERAFQLLTQVAGRSGRRDPGIVVVQTFDPGHRVLEFVRTHDVDGFLANEWEQRRLLGYPPHRRLASVVATAPDEERLDRVLNRVTAILRQGLAGGAAEPDRVQVLGPAQAVLARINRRHRGQLLLKGALGSARKRWILGVFDEVREELRGGRSVDLVLDVDPLHLL